jgi:hypothetical protein
MSENPWVSDILRKKIIWIIILEIDFEKIVGRGVNNNQIYLDGVHCRINFLKCVLVAVFMKIRA